MALKHYEYVWKHYRRSGSHKLVMLALAEYANDNDECWPSMPTISEMTCVKLRQVINIVADLKKSGDIEVVQNKGRSHSNHYKIIIKHALQCTFYDSTTDEENVHWSACLQKENVQSSTRFSNENVQSGTRFNTQNVHCSTPDPTTIIITNTNTNTDSNESDLFDLKSPEKEIEKNPEPEPEVAAAPEQIIVTGKSKSKGSAKPKKVTDPRVRKLLQAYVEVRGVNGINYAQEGVFAKKIIHDFELEDYENLTRETYAWLKKDSFWKYKPVGLSTVFKNIEEYKRFRDRGKYNANGASGGIPSEHRYGTPEMGEWDESKFGEINF